EGQARDRPHHRSMGGPEELLPYALDLVGVLTGEQAEQVVAKVGEHGPPTCSDRVGVSDTQHSLVILDLDEDRLLLDEGLDRIGAGTFRHEVDEVRVDPPDLAPHSRFRLDGAVHQQDRYLALKSPAICLVSVLKSFLYVVVTMPLMSLCAARAWLIAVSAVCASLSMSASVIRVTELPASPTAFLTAWSRSWVFGSVNRPVPCSSTPLPPIAWITVFAAV